MRRRTFLVVSAAAFAALTSPAEAHAMLAHAEPPVGATVHGPISALRLRFTEGRSIAVSEVRAEGDGRVLVARVDVTAAGVYHVRWRAVSVDSHITESNYSFTAAP